MIKFSALNESDSSDDEEERPEGGVDAVGGAFGAVKGAATKEAQEAEVVELFKSAIDVQQKGRFTGGFFHRYQLTSKHRDSCPG